MSKIFLKIFTSPASLYVILRYMTYGLKFFNFIILVPMLGEYSYGIYSFILMFSSYAIYFNLGFNESLNSEYAICKEAETQKMIWNNTLSFMLVWSVIIMCSFMISLVIYPNLFEKYQFSTYGYLLLISCFTHNISSLFATLYKLNGLTLKLNLQQLLPQISLLLLIIIERENINIISIVWITLLTEVLMLVICVYGCPLKFQFNFNREIVRTLLTRGISLLLYNLSFQLLTMMTLAFVSIVYTVEQMGLYSLANNITNGVVMAGGAFLYIFSPKLLNRISQGKEAAIKLIGRMRDVYIVFMDSVSLLSILGVWILRTYFLEYGEDIVAIYALLILGRIINNASTGYATYMIAYKKEKILVICGFASIVILSLLCGIIYLYDLDIKSVALSVVLASLVYTLLVVLFSLKQLGCNISIKNIISEIFGKNKWMICLALSIYVYIYPHLSLLLGGILAYFLLSIKQIAVSVKEGLSVVSDKKSLLY